jgi:hypothetical protein
MDRALEQLLDGLPALTPVSERGLRSLDPETTGLFEVMGWFGDHKMRWDRNNADEVEAAKLTFDRLRGKGFAAFRARPKTGEAGERITEFDPAAESVILVPPIAGGS